MSIVGGGRSMVRTYPIPDNFWEVMGLMGAMAGICLCAWWMINRGNR